jgi:chemotaxis protein MotA
MDVSTIVGIIGGFVSIGLGVVLSGGEISAYYDLASIACTFGGSTFALVIQYSLADIAKMFKILGLTFKVPKLGEGAIVEKLFELAEKARREGILSLEEVINDLDDKFTQQGLRLVVDGTDGEIIKALMENEVSMMNERHLKWIKMLDAWSRLAPGFGMLGTVLGLIGMLRNLADKSRIGPNMAVALITTLYGALMANLLIQPLMGKLAGMDAQETTMKTMIIEGVLSIQAGDNPRILLVKLASFLDPKTKKDILDKYAKD